MDLSQKKCLPCEGGVAPLSEQASKKLLEELVGWELDKQTGAIQKKYSFKNFYRTMSFTNMVAWVANQQNHHPDMKIGYNYCHIYFKTHAIDGLSENDFICAAKIDHVAGELD